MSTTNHDDRRALLAAFRQAQASHEAPLERAFYAHLIRRVGTGTLGVPTVASAAASLDTLLRQDQRATQDLVDLVEADPRLAHEVAEIAGGPQAPDLPRQLARLGLDRLRVMSLRQLLSGAAFELPHSQPAIDVLRQQMQSDGDGAVHGDGVNQSGAYVAALFQRVGRLVLLHAAAAVEGDVPAALIDHEDRSHGAVLGRLLLQRWGFPAEVVQGVAGRTGPAVRGGSRRRR